jgi:hypothetical protein
MTIFVKQDELSLVEAKTKVLTLLSSKTEPISIGFIHRTTRVNYVDLYVVLKQLMDSFAVNEEFRGPKACYSLVRKTEF